MRLYQFTKADHGLAAIRHRRLKISRIHELNDPFEFLGVDLSDRQFRQGIRDTKVQLSQDHGLLCFSKHWRSPLLWAHYADRHRGICLGFDMPKGLPKKVAYVDKRFPKPGTLSEEFVKKLLFTKFTHWSYEDEYRVYLSIDTPINGLYYKDFDRDLVLRQVLVGAESDIRQADIIRALGSSSENIEMFRVRPAFRSFRMVRQKNESLCA